MLVRRLVEHLSRERILVRRLPRVFGRRKIYVSPDSALSYWKRDLSPLGYDLFSFAERFVHEDDTVWDIGANVGLFAFAAAHAAGITGQVLALEPDPFCVSLLRRTANELEGESHVEILPLAVDEKVELATLAIADRGRSSNHLSFLPGRSQAGGSRQEFSVMTVTLDWLLERRSRPDVLKIDVEGAEDRVLAGAQRLLAEARPLCLCEVGEPAVASVTRTFDEKGYALFDWRDGDPVPVKEAAFSTLAIPQERSGDFDL